MARQTLEGDTIRVIERAFEPLPVTAEDRDSAFARLEWFRRQGGRVDMSRVPGHKPAYQRIEVSDDGHLWVRPTLAERGEGDAWDVFDPDGRYLGRVRTAYSLGRVHFRGGRIYAVRADELGVQYVVRLRIDRGLIASGAGH